MSKIQLNNSEDSEKDQKNKLKLMTQQWISAYLHLNRLLLLQHCKLSLATKLEREYQNKNPKFSSLFFLGCFYLTFFLQKITKEFIFFLNKKKYRAWSRKMRKRRGIPAREGSCRWVSTVEKENI